MKAGDLRHRITIQAPPEPEDVSQDNYGQEKPGWSRFAIVNAAIEPLSGREFWNAQQIQATQVTRIRIRYLAGVTERMRVVWGERKFNIQSIINMDERNIELQLMCVESRDG